MGRVDQTQKSPNRGGTGFLENQRNHYFPQVELNYLIYETK